MKVSDQTLTRTRAPGKHPAPDTPPGVLPTAEHRPQRSRVKRHLGLGSGTVLRTGGGHLPRRRRRRLTHHAPRPTAPLSKGRPQTEPRAGAGRGARGATSYVAMNEGRAPAPRAPNGPTLGAHRQARHRRNWPIQRRASRVSEGNRKPISNGRIRPASKIPQEIHITHFNLLTLLKELVEVRERQPKGPDTCGGNHRHLKNQAHRRYC